MSGLWRLEFSQLESAVFEFPCAWSESRRSKGSPTSVRGVLRRRKPCFGRTAEPRPRSTAPSTRTCARCQSVPSKRPADASLHRLPARARGGRRIASSRRCHPSRARQPRASPRCHGSSSSLRLRVVLIKTKECGREVHYLQGRRPKRGVNKVERIREAKATTVRKAYLAR